MNRLRTSLLITFFSTNGATAVNFLVTVALARLLSPHQIGIFSMAAVLVAIAQIFRDFGVSSYLQHEKELTPEKIRATSGVLVVSSWTIAALLYIVAPVAARYFEQPGVRQVVEVLALGFVFIPLGAITHALLTRELRAKEQAYVNVVGTTAYAGTSIALAMLDFGYMSMAWANLVNIIVTGLAYIPFRPAYAPWLPSMHGWKKVTHFGASAVAGNVVGALNNALPDFLLGKWSGPHDVGLFSRANGTSNVFMQVAGPTVNYAVLPHLSKTYHDGHSLADQLSKATAYLTVLAWPALLLTAMFSKEIIHLLYGDKWLECVPIVRITCLSAAVAIAVQFTCTALTAIGRPQLAIIPNAALLLVRVLCIHITYDGTLFNFALGMLWGGIAAAPVYLFLQQRALNFGMSEYLQSLAKSFVVCGFVGAAGLVLEYILPAPWRAWQTLFVVIIVCTPVWVYAVRKIKHPFWAEIQQIWTHYKVSKTQALR